MNNKQKIILYDKGDVGVQGLSWKIYSKIHFGWKSIGVKSWAEAGIELSRLSSIKTIQIWGHGAPGEVYIGDQLITSSFIRALKLKVNKNSLVWFRSCSVFFGAKGTAFARSMSQQLGCRIAAHTRIIAFPWQSGLYSCSPDREPYWIVETGTSKESGRNYPHTIFAGAMNFPDTW